MPVALENLRIDRTPKPTRPRRRKVIVAISAALLLALGAGAMFYRNAPPAAVHPVEAARAADPVPPPGLNATGYIIAAHRIEVASKVVGKVAWIGVEKGNVVRLGQPLVRLEDTEYRAQFLQAEGNLENLEARLAEMEHGSRPEEIEKARSEVDAATAELENLRITRDRTRTLAADGVAARQMLDDAESKYNSQAARVAGLQRTHDLVRLGPRREQIDAARASVKQARGALDFARTQLENTVIRAPVSGTILERNVERGEFVTTGFVGDRGAKGYVVSLADLNDLEVELDISQNDFARLQPNQSATVTTDAYPGRKYAGRICEVSPEANRQKATVQVKIKIEKPDRFLRPDMNASVLFEGTR